MNEKYYRLTILEHLGKDKNYKVQVRCLCDCGNVVIKRLQSIREGLIRSCGCLYRETRPFTGKKNTRHGMSKTRVHALWRAMLARCRTPSYTGYENYGGRGIKVCERWHVFENFLADMGEPPTDKHSIERKDTNGDYCPENCIWATRIEQARNKRSSHMLTFHGQTKTLQEWSEILGIKRSTLSMRIRLKWRIEKAFTTPVKS